MDAALRAVIDRYILDVANVRFLAENLPEGALDRPVVDSEWTVRQVLGHLASTAAAQAGKLAGFADGGDASTAALAEQGTDVSVDDLVVELLASRAAIIAAIQRLPNGAVDHDLDGKPLGERLDWWSLHYARHGIDLAEALPELRFEPMVLNWLLHADLSGDPVAAARQLKLLEEVREKYEREDAEAGEKEPTDAP